LSPRSNALDSVELGLARVQTKSFTYTCTRILWGWCHCHCNSIVWHNQHKCTTVCS
jgi:hypothetical protein